MKVLFFVDGAEWNARARIFTTAAHGIAAKGHQVTLACPPGPIIDRVDTAAVDIVRLDPSAGTALGTFDFRRVASERELDTVFVHSTREQLIVGSALRLAHGGRVVRRVGMFESRVDEPGMLTARIAPASVIVSTNAEAAAMINAGSPPPIVAPLGVDGRAADAVEPMDRRALHLRDDAMIVVCPYAANGRGRVLNMMRALALLAPRHPRLRAVIIAGRPRDDDLRMQAAALGVAPLVQFVDGARTNPVALMKASDVVWVAADNDAGALACLDAMSASRSIIAERSRTIDYFLADGINGTSLPDTEPAAMASAVAGILARAEMRIGQGKAGHSRVQRELDSAPMVEAFERAIRAPEPAGATR